MSDFDFDDYAACVSGKPDLDEGTSGFPDWVAGEGEGEAPTPILAEDIVSVVEAEIPEEGVIACLGELKDGRFFFIKITWDYTFSTHEALVSRNRENLVTLGMTEEDRKLFNL